MRKRTMVAGGGLVGVAALVGVWLSGLFSGSGSGTGAAFVEALGPSSSAQPDEGDLQRVMTTAPKEAAPDLDAEDDRLPGPSEVLEIVVEADGYTIRVVRDGQERFVPVEFSELIALAERTTGNEEGVRVRIFKRESARVSTSDTLLAALKDAGFEQTDYEVQPTLLKERDE